MEDWREMGRLAFQEIVIHKFFFCIYLLKYLKYPEKLKDLLLVLTLKQTLS